MHVLDFHLWSLPLIDCTQKSTPLISIYSSNLKIESYLLKRELPISDFQHFHWLTRHRLSVHIIDVPNMVKECPSNKASWKHSCGSEKKWQTKAVWRRNKINIEELLIVEFFIKQLFYSGLLDIQSFSPTRPYAARWLTMTWYPARPRSKIVKDVFMSRLWSWASVEVFSTLFPTSLKGRRD